MYIVKHFQHCKLLHSVKLPNIISKQFGIFHSFKNFISFSWPSVQTGFSAELAGKSMWPWPSETACRLCFNKTGQWRFRCRIRLDHPRNPSVTTSDPVLWTRRSRPTIETGPNSLRYFNHTCNINVLDVNDLRGRWIDPVMYGRGAKMTSMALQKNLIYDILQW